MRRCMHRRYSLARLSAAQLDNLLAPVALYPDPLLAQMFRASTYPVQLDEAHRLLRTRPSPIDTRTWDSSVKAVAHYPAALQFMDDNLDWTTACGRAFVAQPVDMMKAVQRLRQLARAGGSLVTGQQIEIVEKDASIRIWPANPELLFVPLYEAAVVMRSQRVSRDVPAVSFAAGQKIGAWLNREFDWASGKVRYHGWEEETGWIGRSRPFVQISDVYVSSAMIASGGNSDVTSRGTSFAPLNRWNAVHPDVSFGPAPQVDTYGTTYSADIRRNIDLQDARLIFYRGDSAARLESGGERTRPLLIGPAGVFETADAKRQAQASQSEPVQTRRGYQEKLFATPEEAMGALGEALQTDNWTALAVIFGQNNLKKLTTGNASADESARKQLAERFRISAHLEKTNATTYEVRLGAERSAFPIPIIKEGRHWRFNTAQGLEDIGNVALGGNELAAILTCRAYVLAQADFAAASSRAGGRQSAYAQRFVSSPGRRDGLDWRDAEGARSPKVATTDPISNGDTAEFHGYRFRILKRQGNHAPGGRLSYLDAEGQMVSGSALIAYPSQWGISGIETFIVNQQGRVYAINFGLKTGQIASEIDEYDPDPSWKLVEEGYPPGKTR